MDCRYRAYAKLAGSGRGRPDRHKCARVEGAALDMEASSVTRRDAEYRRGAILGLTVAEVFILLLFMLLLLFLALTNDWKKRQDAAAKKLIENQERLVQVEARLEEWQGVMAEFKAPEEVATLRREKVKLEQTAEQHRQETQVLRKVIEQIDQHSTPIRRANAGSATASGTRQRGTTCVARKGTQPPMLVSQGAG